MSDMAVEIKRRLFTVEEYHELFERGVLSSERDRVELLEGELIEMAPIGPNHVFRHGRICAYLIDALRGKATIFPMGSFPLGTHSEPEPDIAIFPPDLREGDSYPHVSEWIAFIEIADSSFAYDAGPKMRLYAKHGLSDYFLVDVRRNRLLVHRVPTPEGYAHIEPMTYGQTFALTNVPDAVLAVDEFLAPQDRETDAPQT